MNILFIIPPVAFIIILVVVWIEYRSLSLFTLGAKWSESPGKRKPYACGEDAYEHRVQPDYRQFFVFAFFFTIMHVVALMTATLPPASGTTSLIACFYLLSAAVGLFILYRK